MSDPTGQTTASSASDSTSTEAPADVDRDGETEEERAERLAREVAAENPDRTTRREAIEQALAEEDVSDEGQELGQHNP